MNRPTAARILNLLVPGAGLILLRREWLGLSLAVAFTVLAQIAILGWWIVPLDFPDALTWGAGIGAALTWGHAQWLLHCRATLVGAPAFISQLADLRQRAEDALRRGDHAEAQRMLWIALRADDEDVELAVLWAQLMAAKGDRAGARRGWRRVLALATAGEHRRAARQALDSL